MTARNLPFLLLFVSSAFAEVFLGQGQMAGEPTESSILLQSRLTAISGPALDAQGDVRGAPGEAQFEWSEVETFQPSQRSAWMRAEEASDFIVRARVDGLKAGMHYFYRLHFGESRATAQVGPMGRFRTLSRAGKVSFCMGSCMNYHAFMQGKSNGGGPVTASPEDKQLGFPAFAAMLTLKPDFFIGTGDIVYYDHPAAQAAKTLPELRRKWHEPFRFPRLKQFFARTPAYWSKDDHDFRFNDADLKGDKAPLAKTGIEIFREQMPIFEAGDEQSPTYRTHRVHEHVQLWFTEGRDFRSPNKMPDGPEKSIWGTPQREWLKSTLKASDATWKIIITPTPMVGPDRNSKTDNHTNLAGFKHEAESFFQWLRDEKVGSVFTFCGDRHWQYHSLHPLGVEEFSVGALNDENAIRGEKPGGPKTTDPEGKIRQPYLYKEPTGGFLHIVAHDDARLEIEHRDDRGQILNRVVKTPVK